MENLIKKVKKVKRLSQPKVSTRSKPNKSEPNKSKPNKSKKQKHTVSTKKVYNESDYITSFNVPPSWMKIKQAYDDHGLYGLHNIITACLTNYAGTQYLITDTNLDLKKKIKEAIDLQRFPKAKA